MMRGGGIYMLQGYLRMESGIDYVHATTNFLCAYDVFGRCQSSPAFGLEVRIGASSIPEPSTLMLSGIASLALLAMRRRADLMKVAALAVLRPCDPLRLPTV